MKQKMNKNDDSLNCEFAHMRVITFVSQKSYITNSY